MQFNPPNCCATPDDFEVEVAPLFDVPPWRPGGLGVSTQVWRFMVQSGFAHDLVALEDRVVVAAPAGDLPQRPCPEIDAVRGPGRFVFVDPSSLTVIGE